MCDVVVFNPQNEVLNGVAQAVVPLTAVLSVSRTELAQRSLAGGTMVLISKDTATPGSVFLTAIRYVEPAVNPVVTSTGEVMQVPIWVRAVVLENGYI